MPRGRDVRLAIADAIARAGDVPRENIHPCTADEAAAKDDAPIAASSSPH